MTREEILACLTDRPCTVCKFHSEEGCCKWFCVFEEEPEDEDKPVSAILDDMKSGVDSLIGDGWKMIEKRKEREDDKKTTSADATL